MTLAAGAGSTAGPLGLLIILLLGVVTVLLIRVRGEILTRRLRSAHQARAASAPLPAAQRA